MDKENNEDEPNNGQFQSETGRETRIQTCFLVSSAAASPLFYTVSGNQSQEKVVNGKRYYLEQLGCPSIIKPCFRDLPGCTRLSSVGVSSPSYRQFALDKLNKTIMGKSPPTTTNASRRFSTNRGERFMPPIKVNTKIRHIYSHITSTTTSDDPSVTTSTRSRTTSHQSSIHSASATTQTEEDDLTFLGEGHPPQVQSVDEKTAMDHEDDDFRKDASTCMTPPLQMISPDTPLAFSLPPAYAGKLEDLEKITGHIVIQRFFTRADEAFGIWLEKQLGMNVKSVGVGGENDILEPPAIPTARTTPSPSPPPYLYPNLESFPGTGLESASAKKMRESRILEKIIEVDDLLAGEEIVVTDPVEVVALRSPTDEPLEVKDKECSIDDTVKCECFWPQFNQVGESCETTISAERMDNLTKVESEIVSQLIDVEIIPDTQNNEKLKSGTELRLEKQITDKQIFEMLMIPHDGPNETPSSTYDRPCIPDVIDVSQFYNKIPTVSTPPQPQPSQSEETTTETTNEDSEELKTVISNQSSMTDSQLESQYKVVEYLGKLEISSPVNDASTSANSINSELDWVGGGGEGSKFVEGGAIKRSISADSCIGTESSGERNMFNDSGILLDSSRMDMDIPEEGEISSFTITTLTETGGAEQDKLGIEGTDDAKGQMQNVAESSANDQLTPPEDIIEHPFQRPVLSNNQSIDDSTNYSRSDVSSVAFKHISDEGGADADQSESDSELSSLQQKTLEEDPRILEEEGFLGQDDTEVEEGSGLVVDEDDDENDDNEQDELDQFDTIIENHEKEKRLRPIYRKRNVSTQTSKTVESSTVSCTTGSRSTTATSDSSSFDLEFVSKSKKYISHHIPSSSTKYQGHQGQGQSVDEGVGRKRSYLPNGSSGLNVLNMKFTMGREFESEVSIRIPAKSPTASIISSSSSFNYQNLPNAIIPSNKTQGNKKSQTQSQFPAISGTFTKEHYHKGRSGVSHQGQGQSQGHSSSTVSHLPGKLAPLLQQEHDPELKTLWKDVKSKMDNRVDPRGHLEVTGSKINLITSAGDAPSTSCLGTSTPTMRHGEGGESEKGTKLPILINSSEQEKLKRSLKRLKRLLDD